METFRVLRTMTTAMVSTSMQKTKIGAPVRFGLGVHGVISGVETRLRVTWTQCWARAKSALLSGLCIRDRIRFPTTTMFGGGTLHSEMVTHCQDTHPGGGQVTILMMIQKPSWMPLNGRRIGLINGMHSAANTNVSASGFLARKDRVKNDHVLGPHVFPSAGPS